MNASEERNIGLEMHARLTALYPICRSITGDGVRHTLADIQKSVPIEIYEVPSGTHVFDWVVPNEWNIRDAWIKNAAGERVVDFKANSLHVVSYSTPIHATMPLRELKAKIHSLPAQPDATPYRTSYYQKDWGFCMSHNALLALADGQYEVCIDSTLQPGSLTYGELFLPGHSRDEVLFTSHVCHPSLANDNLSGVVVATALAEKLASVKNRRYSYRFLFLPATIGAITWLARNEANTGHIKHGLVLSGLGDAGAITYKRSRQATAAIDRVATTVLQNSGLQHAIQDFAPYGYDERQFCSQGFNLPVGRLSRSPYGTYPQYHTSDDNPSFVKSEWLGESLRMLLKMVSVLEGNRAYLNTQPKCEPQLGRRGLYNEFSQSNDTIAMLWVLNYSDGEHSLLDIAERASLPFESLLKVAMVLEANGLLKTPTKAS